MKALGFAGTLVRFNGELPLSTACLP